MSTQKGKCFQIPRDYEKSEKCEGSFNSNKSLVWFLLIFFLSPQSSICIYVTFSVFSPKSQRIKSTWKTVKKQEKENQGRSVNWFNVVDLKTSNILKARNMMLFPLFGKKIKKSYLPTNSSVYLKNKNDC